MNTRYLITGAASGIGRAVAELAAADGAALCLVDRDGEGLERLADSLDAPVTTVVADLAEPEAPATVVSEAVTALGGGLDVLVSNAGAPVVTPLAELTVEGFDRSVALNARATWLLGRAARPWLAESRGAIVATGSVCGHHPTPPLGAYSVAKAALLMAVKQMALEWGPEGIRANSVSPGPTISGLTAGIFTDMDDPEQRAMRERRESHLPLRKIGTSEEVARAVLYLAGPGAAQITGIDVLVDGGLSLSLMPAAGGGAGQNG